MGQPTVVSSKPEKPPPSAGSVNRQQFGVWQILTLNEAFSWRAVLGGFLSGLPLIKRIVLEVYHVAPGDCLRYMLAKLWSGVESALLVYFSTRLLRIIEIGLIEGRPDMYAIASAVAARLLCVVIAGALQWWTEESSPKLRARLTSHFELSSKTEDGPTNLSRTSVSARGTFDALIEVVRFLTEILTTFSQLILIFHSSRMSGGRTFALLCVAKPTFYALTRRNLWSRPFVMGTTNTFYHRMRALASLADPTYKQDVISGDLGEYVVKEYKKASVDMGDASDEWPALQYQHRPSPTFDIISGLLGDLPMVYCAINTILNPQNFDCVHCSTPANILEFGLDIGIHARLNTSHGTALYPGPCSSEKGMALELRNVSFTYPGTKATKPALADVSFSVQPGQLVVIVGENGSGKSTVVKILSQLYDPTTGEYLLDGLSADSYRPSDLRQATTNLTQDHSIYNLSLAENIGMGCVAHVDDMDMIADAARLGGATHCISKLVDGMQTVLDPLSDACGINLPAGVIDHPLAVELEKLEKKVDISGGEDKGFARTFMRFKSGTIRFVAVDEPSSALDPDGELQLFNRLIEHRTGKTMVFVTHRFGHLTKHADIILCMKDGALVERGTHEHLMTLQGEYAKLYNIQAQAFASAQLGGGQSNAAS
ncbi:P-loop containing nucleoside triphosphate hydrolase protein [Infundibulicybe gibba]|nr:P-loop containing nucleoside triphosphate hydrolase protein [Infundibulicybe gibba]